jgi:PAS domain S-box-containing protein
VNASHPEGEPQPSSRNLSYTAAGILLGLVLLVVILFREQLSSINNVLAWMTCCALFVLAGYLDERQDDDLWHGYRGLAVMSAWLTQSLSAALGVLALGTALVLAIKYWRNKDAAWWRGALLQTAEFVVLALVPLLMSWLALAVLTGLPALDFIGSAATFATEMVVPLVGMLLAYFLAGQAARYMVARWRQQRFIALWNATQYGRLINEITLLPMILIGPIVYFTSGPGVFVMLLLMVMAFAYYQHQNAAAGQRSQAVYVQSADLLRKLALVNRTTQNALFRVDQDVALKTACQTAMAVTQSDRVAIWIADRDADTLMLAESINLPEGTLPRTLTFDREALPATPQVVVGVQDEATPKSFLRSFHATVPAATYAEVPLHSGNVVLGYLVVYHSKPHYYSGSEMELLEILAHQIAAVQDNAHLLRTLEFHALDMTHLAHLSRISSASLKLNTMAGDVTGVLRQMLAMDWAMIALLNPKSNQMEVVGMSGGNSLQEGDTLQYKLPVFAEITRLREDDEPTTLYIQMDQAGLSAALRSYMDVSDLQSLVMGPMVIQQQTFGVILLGTKRRRTLSEREMHLVDAALNQVTTQIYNGQLYDNVYNNLLRQLQQIAFIREIVQRIAGSNDFNIIIESVFEAALKTTEADLVGLGMLTESGDFWVIEQVADAPAGEQRRGFSQVQTEGIIGKALEAQSALLIRTPTTTQSAVFASSMAVPVQREGRIVAVLYVASRREEFFNSEQIDFLRNLGGHAVVSLENRRLLSELEYQVQVQSELRSLSVTLSRVYETRVVAHHVIETAMELLDGQYAGIFQCGPRPRPTMLLEQIAAEGSVISTTQSIVVADLVQKTLDAETTQVIYDANITYKESAPEGVYFPTLVAAPIMHNDEIYQVICVGYQEQHRVSDRDLDTLSLLATQAAGHLENATLHETINDVNTRLRAIMDSTRDGVVLLDERGRLVEVNPAAERLIGIDLHSHIGEPFLQVLLQYMEASDRQVGYSRDELKQLMRIQRLQPRGITRREFTQLDPNLQPTYIEETGSPVYGDNGQVMGRLLVLRDISEEKKLEEYRSEVTGMVVHDLRAPLASVMSSLQLALDQTHDQPDSEMLTRVLNLGVSNADNMLNLVNTLLDIRKGKELALDRSVTAIDELIDLTQLRMQTIAEKARISIQTVIPDDLPRVNIDREKIGRVLQNLIDNALKFTPAGQPILIGVEHQEAQKKLVVRVADSGPGIPERDRTRVFDQFWQSQDSKPLRGSKGSGIGLAFCKLVVEAHGERIWVEASGPLPGASFVFTLPVG